MGKKTTKGFFGLLMALLMLMPVFAIVPLQAEAAASTVTITIDKVTRKYKEAAKWFGYVNEQRAAKGLSALTMDTDLMETAMTRAAELSVYVGMKRLDGTEFVNQGTEFRSEMYSYGQILNKATIINDSNETIMSSKVKSIGVGYVEGKGSIKYMSILTSENKGTEVDSSVLTQSNTSVDQQTECLPQYLNDIALNFSDGKQIQCGSNMTLRYVVTNQGDNTCTAYVSSKLKVTSSDNSIFMVNDDNTVLAVQPGSARLDVSMAYYPQISVSINVTAVAKSFSGCTIADIPDQLYTGSALTPPVTLTTSTGTVLQVGTHYTLRYYNNIKVGTGCVVITGAGSYAGKTGTATFKIIENPNAFKATITANKTEMEQGESATISANSVNGTAPVNYMFQYRTSDADTFSNIQSYSTASSCSFKPTSAGKYIVRVTAKDKAGKLATADMELNVHVALKCVTSISASTLTLGNTVTFKGYASGGVSPYKYKISQRSPSDSGYKVVYDYGTTNSYVCKPTESGVWELKIECKDSYGSVVSGVESVKVSDGALVNRSTVSATSVTNGTPITMTGTATGGFGGYKYAYSYKVSTASTWTTIRDYSTAVSGVFLPAGSGSYNLKVDVKDSAGNVASKQFTVTVKASSSTLTNNSTVSTTSLTLGKALKITGAASGGSSPYKYAFYYKKSTSSTWAIKGTEYGTATSVSITPASAVVYDIMVNVKDNAGTVKSKYYTVTVKKAALTNSSTISTTSTTVGNTVTLKGAASGGKAPYTYAFLYKKSTADSWSHIGTKYGTATSGSFVPGKAVNYDVMINVKDASGTVKSKTFTVKVGASTLVNNSTISATSITKGTAVTVKGAASGGAGGYTYAFLYKKASASTWSHIGTKYGTATSGTFTPASNVMYDVMINVKDKGGVVKSKSFKLTVSGGTLTNSATVSATSVTAGTKVSIKGAASGGTSPYTYAFYYKKSSASSWTTAGTAFGTAKSASFTPQTKTTYNVKITVKDATGKTASKTYNVTVK